MSTSSDPSSTQSVLERRAPSWLTNAGIRSWLVVGVIAVIVLAYLGIGAAATLTLPAVIAIVIGALFAPLVEYMAAHHVPKILAALLVILALFAVIVATLLITISGVIDQASEIEKQLAKGMTELTTTLNNAGFDIDKAKATSGAADAPSQLANKALGHIGDLFSSLGALLFGAFVTVYLLFYALMDWPKFEHWLGERIGVPASIGRKIVDEAVHDLRLYFGGLTIASIIVAIIIGITMWALDLPLALTVVIVTFVTAYIPYVGAIVSGAFAFLVALGSGGLGIALVVLAVVLVSQNVVQAVLQARITSDSLEVHPTVNFASTILGAIVAGAVGAILAAPVVATMLKARRMILAYDAERDGAAT